MRSLPPAAAVRVEEFVNYLPYDYAPPRPDDGAPFESKTPELVIVDGAPGLEKALAALWSDVPVQRCTVHKHRNLLAHAPERLHEEISNDYKDMIYAETKQEVLT